MTRGLTGKWVCSLLALMVLMVASAAFTAAESELNGKYITVKDGKNRIITQTAHKIVVGDEYRTDADRLYRVYQVKGETAVAKLVRERKATGNLYGKFKTFVDGMFEDFFRAEVKGRGPIGIFHTHSDESYNPSDGTSSKPAKGGIFQVGDALTDAFERQGVPVVHSKTPHDPHDAMAYDRSRRTAVQLLKDRPSTLLDVHRDATPPSTYLKKIGNQDVTKIQLVVGRQNPNIQANNNFAQQIMTSVNRKYPGLVKGIFYGKGKYNQDLGPRTMLLEFGTNTTTKQQAERSAQLFASASREVLFGNVGAASASRGSSRSLFWIIVALVIGVGIFFVLNRGGLKRFGKEFTGAIGENTEESGEKSPSSSSKPDQDGE